jgi:NAD(P)-dependent dehydrogenase (short-subunit alcohol dehydrogenase family)
MIDQEGGESFAFEADVTKAEDCRRMAEKCLEAFGRIDVLVNVVGIGERTVHPEAEVSEEEWDRIMEVNLKGMFLTCKFVLPVMEKQESGAVVNISSYKVAKAGVNALTHQKAMKVAPKGVRVNAIMPGLLNTPMAIEGWAEALGQDREEVIRFRDMLVPLKGGMGDAWDTAYAALFLASDEAKFITAAVLPVDGGQSGRIQ